VSNTLQAIRGMNDVLPDDMALWRSFSAIVESSLERWGYRAIRMPLVESTALFRRAIGEATDIVEKEMYSWRDELNAEELTLRPEGTASCVRAAIEHSLIYDGPKRLWYGGPMYRHERPQKGRYREFYQYGAEAVGFPGPDVDAELIVLCARLWPALGLQGIRLELNNIGSAEERARHRADLVKHLEANEGRLDADAKRRLHTNPLRVLDSKNPMVQEVAAKAPPLAGYLGEASLAHFEGLKKLLSAAGVEFTLNPRLVRGLDYYNLTVFEWITDALGAQGTVCGGGRYDGLFAQLGGKPAPGVGFAMGCERLVALMKDSGRAPAPPRLDAYVVHQGEGTLETAFVVADVLRGAGHAVVMHAGGGSFKTQMKRADASGAWVALIVGEDEVRAGEISVKALRTGGDERGDQRRIARARVAEEFAAILKKVRT
jgi:histidyl-tRNA synthetase